MKQTNNAIKFLMAQYRAIFKNAYFKGLTSAVLLTAGLAVAGGAQAATLTTANLPTDGKTVIVDGTDNTNIRDTAVTDATLNGSLIINSGAASDNNTTGNLLQASAAANITGDKFGITIDAKSNDAENVGLAITANSRTSGTAYNVNIGSLTIRKGSLGLAMSTSAQSGDLNVTADSITIGTGTTITETGNNTASKIAAIVSLGGGVSNYAAPSGDGIITFGNNATEADTKSVASVTTLNKSGIIQFLGADTHADKVIFAGQLIGKGGSLDFSSGDGTIQAYGTDVNANVVVGGGHEAVVDLEDLKRTEGINEGLLQFTSGTINLHGAATGTSGGQLQVTDGTLAIEGNTVITSVYTPTAANDSVGSILVSGTSATDNAILRTSSAQIVSFLSADHDGKAATANDSEGGVILSGSAAGQSVLEFNDTATVDLYDLVTDDPNNTEKLTIKIGNTNTAVANTLNVSGGTIKATNLAVSDADSTNLNLTKAFLEADNLTLGSVDYDDNGANKITVSGSTAHNSLTLLASGDTFTITTGTHTLDAQYYDSQKDKNGNWISNTVAPAHYIKGDDIKLSGAAAVDLKVTGGTWQTSGQDITLAASGSLIVSASGASGASNVYNNDGNPATLIMDGGQLIIAGTDANGGKVNVTGASGANATLDLTQANKVTFTSGSITVSGSAIGLGSNSIATDKFEDEANASDFYADAFKDKVGYGILKLNQTTFDDYVKQTAGGNGVTLTISGSGIVEVSDLHTNQYDVDKFSGGTSPAVGTVLFSGDNSYFVVNGDLNLYDGEDSVGSNGEPVVGEATDVKGLNIGSGTIIADRVNLTIYGRETVSDSEGNESTIVSDAKFVQGTVEVSEGFTTNSSTLVLGADNSGAALVLDAGIGNTGTLMGTGSRTIEMVGGDAASESGGKIEIETGAWGQEQIDISATGVGTGLTVGTDDEVFINRAQALSTEEAPVYVAQYTGDNYNGASGSNLTVNEQSLATFNTMQLGDGSTVSVEGHLLINGLNVANPGADATDPAYVNPNDDDTYTTTAGISFGNATVTVDGPTANLEFGATATSALVNLNGDPDDENSDKSTIILTEGGINNLGTNLSLKNFGHLTLNFADGTELNADDAKFFTGTFLGHGTSDETNYLVLNNANLGIEYEPRTDGLNEVKWENLKPFVNIVGSQATTDKLMTALVSHIGAGEAIKGHYGAASVDAASNTDLSLNGPTSFHNAAAFGGNFVTSERDGKVMGVQFTNEYTSLSLENGGTIGSITGSNDYDRDDYNSVYITSPNGVLTKVEGSVTEIKDFTVDSETEVNGSVAVNYLDLASTLTTTAQNQGVAVNGGVIRSAAELTTAQLEIGGANSHAQDDNDLEVLGSVKVTGTEGLTLNGNASLAIYGGNVSTTNLTFTNDHGDLLVGYEPEQGAQDDVTTDYMDESLSYTGYLEVTGATEMNGSNLIVDPEYGQATAMVSLNDLYNAPVDANSLVAGTLDGNIFVGQNSALGIGSDSMDTLRAKVAQFQNGQTLVEDQVGAVVYLGNSFTLGAGQGFVLTNLTTYEFTDYYNRNDGATVDVLTDDVIGSGEFDNTVFLGANTVLMVDAGVMSAADTSRATPTAVISFAGNANGNTNGTGKVIADGGDIVIDGDVRASTYKVFNNATIKYIDGSDYKVVEDSEAAHYDDNINVSTENDFLQGVVDANGQVTLGVNPNGRAIMHGASDPVYESLVAYARGYNGPEYDPTAEEPSAEQNQGAEPPVTTPVTDNGIQGVEDSRELYSYNEQGDKVYGQYSNYFLQETISTGDGSAAEAVARLAVFGGAAQAAISAGASTYDAVSGRMGVGANGANITVADNTQGAALWLAPVYKSSDSDGFDAEGVDYGVDMDLYGVALGADYTLSNGIRFGAMFNVGSGEVDGQGAGSAVSNDFDYYGFAVYGGYSMGALSVVADVSYTVADNDLEGNTSIDKVGASLDSTNLSVGVTGQYQLDFNGATVTPHAGLRFSRIDLDDYIIDGEDVIADYDADSMNIFSIPVGVTFAKEFTGDAWTVKPSLDLTLTGNFGDDETDGTVHWAGVENLSTNVSSEVLDNFTYGATLGVAAKTGNFSLGLGVNYTGSSNVDEFGVQANARFVF